MKSTYVERLDAVQQSVTSVLKPLGFKKKGRVYNRSYELGTVQVISLQMGQYEIGAQRNQVQLSAKLPFMVDLYGRFTVNLGVFVREIWETENSSPAKTFISESSCQIRRRLGSSQVPGKEYWWKLDEPVERIVADIVPLLQEDGLPFLEHFATKKDIIERWVGYKNNGASLSRRARVDVAVLLAKQGDRRQATQLLAEQVSQSAHKSHRDYVIALAQELGLRDLTNNDSPVV